jgi:hypothetical protein
VADKEEVRGEERFYPSRTRDQEVELLLNNLNNLIKVLGLLLWLF